MFEHFNEPFVEVQNIAYIVDSVTALSYHIHDNIVDLILLNYITTECKVAFLINLYQY